MKAEKFDTNLLEMKCVDIEAKHIAKIDSLITSNYLFESSLNAGYKFILFGSHRKMKWSLDHEINVIESMLNPNFERPVRIVIDKLGRKWADNTHSTIAYVLRLGLEVTLSEIPFYIIDLRDKNPLVVSLNGTVSDSIMDIENAISAAQRIQFYVENNIRPLEATWKIKDLMKQLDFL